MAAHVAIAWILTTEDGTAATTGFDADGAATAVFAQELQRVAADWRTNDNTNAKNRGMALVVVRYFGQRLLGVSCGRLSQCYASIARRTLHRHIHGDSVPLRQEFWLPTTNYMVWPLVMRSLF